MRALIVSYCRCSSNGRLSQWHNNWGASWGTGAGARALEASTHFTQLFKNAFFTHKRRPKYA